MSLGAKALSSLGDGEYASHCHVGAAEALSLYRRFIVTGIASATDRGCRAGISQAFGLADSEILLGTARAPPGKPEGWWPATRPVLLRPLS